MIVPTLNGQKTISFPCLMINQNNAIILAIDHGAAKGTYQGTLLKKADCGSSNNIIGTTSRLWTGYSIYNGSITLQNQ